MVYRNMACNFSHLAQVVQYEFSECLLNNYLQLKQQKELLDNLEHIFPP